MNAGVPGRPAQAFGPVLCFELGELHCALPLVRLGEILRVPKLTEMPGAPAHVCGVIGAARAVITVFDLGACVGLCSHVSSERSRILLMRAGPETLGLLVGAVLGVQQLCAAQVEPVGDEQPACGLLLRCVMGRAQSALGESAIWVLDAERLLA